MKSLNSILCVLLLILLPILGSAAFEKNSDEIAGDAILAMVGEEVITLQDVLALCKAQEEAFRQNEGFSPEEQEKNIHDLRKAMLTSLIDQELIYMEFQRLKAKLPQDYLQMRLNQIIQGAAGGDAIKFEEELYKQGTTMTAYRKKLQKLLAVELLTREKTSRGILIPQEAIQNFYQEHLNDYFKGERKVRVSVILIKTEGKTEEETAAKEKEVSTALQEGMPFEEAAKKYSEGANAENGGDQGWQPGLVTKLEEAIRPLEVGQISSTTLILGNNHYFLQLTGRDPGLPRPLDEKLTEMIRDHLGKQEEARRYAIFLRELNSRYPVIRTGLEP